MIAEAAANADHELLRTAVVGGVGICVAIIAFFVKGMAGDVKTAVAVLAKHETELAKLNLRMERTEGDVNTIRARQHELANQMSGISTTQQLDARRKASGE